MRAVPLALLVVALAAPGVALAETDPPADTADDTDGSFPVDSDSDGPDSDSDGSDSDTAVYTYGGVLPSQLADEVGGCAQGCDATGGVGVGLAALAMLALGTSRRR